VLRYRFASVAVLLPVIFASVILGGPFFLAVMALATLVAMIEFLGMLRHAGYRPSYPLGLGLVVFFLADGFAPQLGLLHPAIFIGVLFVLIAILWQSEQSNFLVNWALTVVGAIYIGGLGAHLLLLRGLPEGQVFTGVTLLAVWATDGAAFLAGSRWGKHPFFPHVSPKKTWEGAIGGFIGGTVAFGVLGTIYGLHPLVATLFGLGVSLATTFGDLAESLLKRQTGVKDSGNLIPGHGGMLDRIDSMLFAGAFAYYGLLLLQYLNLSVAH
jgi:phosphatidate cytidylyltransferase